MADTVKTLGAKAAEAKAKKAAEAAAKAAEAATTTEETKATGRKSTGGNASAPRIQENRSASRRLSGNGRAIDWYKSREGDLVDVTNEASNPVLGISEIRAFGPSDAQWEAGVVARVVLETPHIEITGIQVRESNRDGGLYVQLQSRMWEVDGNKQYHNDVKISSAMQAQILCYIEALLEEQE